MQRRASNLFRLVLMAAAGMAAQGCSPSSSSGPATGAPIASLPLDASAPPAPAALAPAANQLTSGPPISVIGQGPPDPYRYVDEAYDMGEAFADSPPDYTVDYDGTRPWIWRAQDGAYRVVEQIPGGERIYYFQPGADTPFLVSDPEYAYAYDQGGLVMIYDAQGRPLAPDFRERRADVAAGYLARARQLFTAVTHEQRRAAYAANWQSRQAAILEPQQQWGEQADRDPDWRSWHDSHPPAEQAAWSQEQNRRKAYVAQLTQGGAPTGSGPPPPARPVSPAPPAPDQRQGPALAPAQPLGPGPSRPEAGPRAPPAERRPDQGPPAGPEAGAGARHEAPIARPQPAAPERAAPTPPPHAAEARPPEARPRPEARPAPVPQARPAPPPRPEVGRPEPRRPDVKPEARPAGPPPQARPAPPPHPPQKGPPPHDDKKKDDPK